jgi:UDP-GlcNAc3NAcA epimerase
MRVLTVVGARPQFIKAAPVRRALLDAGHQEILVHTGQHYDDNMSAAHFRDLELATPEIELHVGSGRHGVQTARMLEQLEPVIAAQTPDWVLVYGDTNSTLAAALAAAKLRTPLAHIEAGQRSYKRSMPEEINRVLTDHASDLLLCATPEAVANLGAEGMRTNVHLVGDVMIDALDWMLKPERRSDVLERYQLTPGTYLLATVHRQENTDDASRLAAILQAFDQLNEPIVFPIHPRTRRALPAEWSAAAHVRLVDPVSYREMVALEGGARMILTDSGGMQKEAYYLGVPCVILRDETEWNEIVEAGWAVLAGADCERIVAAVTAFRPPTARPRLHGDGHAAAHCVTCMEHAHVR